MFIISFPHFQKKKASISERPHGAISSFLSSLPHGSGNPRASRYEQQDREW